MDGKQNILMVTNLGFEANHICHLLEQQGYHVICNDNEMNHHEKQTKKKLI